MRKVRLGFDYEKIESKFLVYLKEKHGIEEKRGHWMNNEQWQAFTQKYEQEFDAFFDDWMGLHFQVEEES